MNSLLYKHQSHKCSGFNFSKQDLLAIISDFGFPKVHEGQWVFWASV